MRSKIKGESDSRQRGLGFAKNASYSANRNTQKPADLQLNSEKQDRILKKLENNATTEDDVRVINQSMLDDINKHLQQFSLRPKVHQSEENKFKLSRSMISSPKHFALQNKMHKADEKHQRVVSALANQNSHFEKLQDEKQVESKNNIFTQESNKIGNDSLQQTLVFQNDNKSMKQNNMTTISIDSDSQKENKVTYISKQEQKKGMVPQYISESSGKGEAFEQNNLNNSLLNQNQNVRGYFRREQYQEKEYGKYKDRQLVGVWQQQIIEKKMLLQQDKFKDNSFIQNTSQFEESCTNKFQQEQVSQNKLKSNLQMNSQKDVAANTSSSTDNSNTNQNGTQTSQFTQKTTSKCEENLTKFNQFNNNLIHNSDQKDKQLYTTNNQNIFNLQRSQSVEQNLNGDEENEDMKNETANFKPSDFEPQNQNIKNEEFSNQSKNLSPLPSDLSSSMIQSQKPQTSQSISPKINSSQNYSSYSQSRNTTSHTAVSNNDRISANHSQNTTNNNSFIEEQQYQQQIIAQIAKNGQKNLFQNKNNNKNNSFNQSSNVQNIYSNNENQMSQKQKIKNKQNLTNLVSNCNSNNNSEIKGRIRLSPISRRLESCQPNNQAKQKYNSFLNDLQELKITNGADSSNSDSFIQHNHKQSTINDDYSTEMTSIEHKSQSNQIRQPIYQKSIKKIEAENFRQNNSMCCDNRIQQSRKRTINSCNKQYLVSEGNQSSYTNEQQYIYSIYANQARRKSDDHLEMLQLSAKKFQQPNSIDYLAPDFQDYDDNFKQQMNVRKNNKDEKGMQQLVDILKMQGYESNKIKSRVEENTKFQSSYKYSSNDKISIQDQQETQIAQNDEQNKMVQAKIRASTAHTSLQKRGSEKIPKKQKIIIQVNSKKPKENENNLHVGGVFYNKDDNIITFYNGDSSQKKLNKTEEANDKEDLNIEKQTGVQGEQQLINENTSSQDIIYYQQDNEPKRKLQNKTQSEKKGSDNSILQNKIVQNSSFNEFLNFNDNEQKKNYLMQVKMFSNQELQNQQEQQQFQQKYNYFVDFERQDSLPVSNQQKVIMRKQNSSQPPHSAQNTNTIQSLFNKENERQKYGILYNKHSFNSYCNSPFQDNKISVVQQAKEVNPFSFEHRSNQIIDQQQISQKNIQQQQLIKMNSIQNQLRHARSISSHYQQFYQNNEPVQSQNNHTFSKQNNNNYQDLKSQKSLWSDISLVENSFIKLTDKVLSSNNINNTQQQNSMYTRNNYQQNNQNNYSQNSQNNYQQNSQNKQRFPRDVFTPNVSVMRKKLNSNNQS